MCSALLMRCQNRLYRYLLRSLQEQAFPWEVDMHDTKERLSLFWIFALLNYLYADVVALFAIVGSPNLADAPHLPPWALLGSAVLMEIPIAMIVACGLLLFHQVGDLKPLTSADVVGRSHQALKEYQAGILAEYVPYTPITAQNLKKLADLKPKTLAIMHGSSFTGDCARALDDLNLVLLEVFGPRK